MTLVLRPQDFSLSSALSIATSRTSISFFLSTDWHFFVLGVAFAIQPKEDSRYYPGSVLWLLAGFGITHGIQDWADLSEVHSGIDPSGAAPPTLIRVVSYVFLFEFGRRLTRHSWCALWPGKNAPVRYSALWYVPAFTAIAYAVVTANNPWVGVTITAKYLLGFPASSRLSDWYFNYRVERYRLQTSGAGVYFSLAAAVLLTYGISSGLLPTAATFFGECFQCTAS